MDFIMTLIYVKYIFIILYIILHILFLLLLSVLLFSSMVDLLMATYRSVDKVLFTGTWTSYQWLHNPRNSLFFPQQLLTAYKSSAGQVRPHEVQFTDYRKPR